MASEAGRNVNIRKFAQEFVANGGNGTQAVMKAKPMKYDSARTRAKDLIRRPDVQAEIKAAMDKLDLNYEYVLRARQMVIDRGIKDLADGKVKVSVADLHSHLQGVETIFTRLEKHNIQDHSDIHLHVKNLNFSEAIKQRQSYTDYFNDVIDGETVEDTASLEESQK